MEDVNTHRRGHMVDTVGPMLGGSVVDQQVAVPGMTFELESDSVRHFSAPDIAVRFHSIGTKVVVHLTDRAEPQALIPRQPASLVTVPQILEGRNLLEREQWTAAGSAYSALGRGTVPARPPQTVLLRESSRTKPVPHPTVGRRLSPTENPP